MALSTENRALLHAELVIQIRRFIAGTILFNQKAADRAGLHLTDMQCINLLELLGGSTTPGKLAEGTGLTTGGVTVMLDRLEKAGFIRRERNPNDRRSVLVRVNPRRLQKVNVLYAGVNRQVEALLRETPEAELRAVAAFFLRMNTVRREQVPG
ncbi:MAG TPA: MarR family transcriptional regulator [Bryobacteraceae bacterium]|jgi:DNA-binding MarR family transcriptional regulator